jgi:hypothetical protein
MSNFQIPITVYLVLDNKIKYINITSSENTLIKDIIKRSISEFNTQLEKDNYMIRLSLNYEHYNLKPSKKNGMAKEDLPCINIIN